MKDTLGRIATGQISRLRHSLDAAFTARSVFQLDRVLGRIRLRMNCGYASFTLIGSMGLKPCAVNCKSTIGKDANVGFVARHVQRPLSIHISGKDAFAALVTARAMNSTIGRMTHAVVVTKFVGKLSCSAK